MQLNDFQARFKDLMLDNPQALDAPPADLAAFCKEGGIALPTRLKVYRNNIVGSLTDMLKATFPTVQTLVGDKFFETLARSFILAHPPSKGVLSHYGAGMDEFIASFEPAKTLPYLPDVAAYEVAKNESYYAADDLPLTAQQLGIVPPEELEDLQLELRTSAILIHSRYPLSAIEAFCESDDAQSTFDLDQGEDYLMIYRPALDVDVVHLAEDEFSFLKQLSEGSALGDATAHTLDRYPDFDIQAALQKHLALETFRALSSNT